MKDENRLFAEQAYADAESYARDVMNGIYEDNHLETFLQGIKYGVRLAHKKMIK